MYMCISTVTAAGRLNISGTALADCVQDNMQKQPVVGFWDRYQCELRSTHGLQDICNYLVRFALSQPK